MKLWELAESRQAGAILAQKWPREELDKKDADGRTALMHAAARGDYKTAEALRSQGADVALRDADGRKAVDLAALYGHGVVIAYLIEGGCGG